MEEFIVPPFFKCFNLYGKVASPSSDNNNSKNDDDDNNNNNHLVIYFCV
jgi:hypothetical protein